MSQNKFRKKSKKKLLILILLIAAVIGGLVLALHSCAGGDEEEMEEAEIMTASAERMTISKSISSDGEIKSSLEEKKTPHAGYNLEKVNVSEGQAVKEGNAILTYTNGQAMAAPYDCVVLEWNLPDPKQMISHDHYVKIAGTHVMTIELTVKEDEVGLVKKGNPATVKVNATNKKYNGEVTYISDIGDYEEGTSSFKVRVTFDNDGSLKLGMNGKARIILARAENVLAVPADAVTEDTDGSFVTLQKGDDPENTETKQVETGISDGKNTEIKSGLKEGDVVQYMTFSDEEGWEDEMLDY